MESFKVGKKKHHPDQKACEELSGVHTVVWHGTSRWNGLLAPTTREA
jgi:hypothetical protein